MKNTIFIGLLILTLIGLTACSTNPGSTPTTTQQDNNNNNINTNNTFAGLTASQDLKQFSNIDELKTFLAQQSTASNSASDNSRGGPIYNTMVSSKSVSSEIAPTSAPQALGVNSGAGASSSVDYSQTNVQVQNVDEGDFVKNDDKYIYMIVDNKLVIIDGTSGANSKIVSQTDLTTDNTGYYYGVKELFLNRDKVIVFRDSSEKTFYLAQYDITPIDTEKQDTKAYVYDVSDRTSPKLVQEITISGTYYSSRMINNIVYIVTQEGLYNWQYYTGPVVSYAKTIIRPSIYYFDNPDQNYQMNTITSINMDDNSVVDAKSLMLGYGNTLMVSENNIYIAYQKQNYWCFGWRCAAQDTDNRNRFVTVVVPLLQGDLKTQVQSILDKGLTQDEEWSQISTVFNTFYTELNNDSTLQSQYEKMFTNIEDALNEYDTKKLIEQSQTVIQKLSIKDGKIDYVSKGVVEGRLLNQYSLDEYNGNLRVATTTNFWLNKVGSVEYNNVFVLDEGMNIVGSLKNLAENESIYSTRFMGNKLYMVTFRQVDPFFVIDLSNPTNPEVLGYLKIPGYSSYLHPVNASLIIAVGKATTTNEYGGVTTQGVKISLFDVSDFSNPKEVDSYEIGLEGTDSPILYDPKAFLYSSTKNILVIPVTEVAAKIPSGQYNYRLSLWNGAYVFKLTDTGFALIGKVKHSSSETEYYNWFNSASVMRSLYIDNSLYTISTQYVKVNDLNNNLTSVNSITLPATADNTPTPVPIMY